ncbi:MAG TPA: hypothetical protein VJ698_04685 [Noviherbaspirillum sp.]|uniref:hypothetical protein n=1 Tax=Noviherbaspirillum sp. TaxID=1926288 RepID=UPI002B45F539|nr:hypothetical protein [Noviherbaspirillum sp.]HJV84750.1 hypothetical protein [Noviherbaspirillum sp.]
MAIPTSRASVAALFVTSILMAACGGGGGTSGPTSGQAGSSTPVTGVAITSANSRDVSAQVYSASQGLNNQVTSTPAIVTAVSTSGNGTGIIDAMLQQIYFALKHPAPGLAVGVTATDTVACSGAGSATFAANVANANTVTSGDHVNISTSNCVEGTVKMNGVMDIVFNSVSGTPSETSAWSASLAVTFSAFSVTEGFTGASNTATGDLALIYNQSGLNDASFSGSGNSLQMHVVSSTSTSDYTLTAYTYSGSVTPANLYTYRSNFTVSGDFPRVGSANYVVRTTTDFKQQRGSYPSQGVMTITANDHSSLKFTVLNTTSVQLGLDKNGDGTMEDSITTTWADLKTLF